MHILADVALPLVHDSLSAWESVGPDIFQQMLLAGIAVDSPKDAAALHPELFTNEKTAQKCFERAGFKRHSSYNTYRVMSLKSAAYRRAGRGRGWQRAYWLEGGADAVKVRLEAVLGDLAEWKQG